MKNILHVVSTLSDIRRDFPRFSLWIIMLSLIMIPQILFAQGVITNQNHYKTWMTPPQQFQVRVLVEDQFMKDSLTLQGVELLSNPTFKSHEGKEFPILNPDQHLTWYRATGRDTSIDLAYKNQFESTAVTISNVEFLLIPTQKYPHPPPINLDHYKAYRIPQAQILRTPVMLSDQFDDRYGMPEYIDSLMPTFFLTPAVKNMESELYDSITHYVAYQIFPPRFLEPPFWEYMTMDQFGEHYLQIMHSIYLLVPSEKFLPPPAPPDTAKEHYKSWRVASQPFDAVVRVEDQIMTDDVHLLGIEYLSNPTLKVHGENTFLIKKPDNHLTWYRAEGRDTLLLIDYVNQFESTAVAIGSTEYLLVPNQKLPHASPESLDHYKAYEIINAPTVITEITLADQFDELLGIAEYIDSLKPLYFLTPAMKNSEQTYDMVTHYVAYEIFPKVTFQYPVTTVDQFGQRELMVQFSDLLMVPTKKLLVSPPPDSLLGSLCGKKCNDLNGNSVCDQGEPLLTNWSITLTSSTGGITSMLTNSVGTYCFNGLLPGQYTISETIQPGWQQTGPPPPGTYTVNLLLGQSLSGFDFANIKIPDFDSLTNHYEAWRTTPLTFNQIVRVEDQLMMDSIHLIGIDFLSNPVKKTRYQIVSKIVEPDYHLTWYKAEGVDTLLKINYINQFESTAVFIDSPEYLLVPTQKLPHSPPDSLDHYKAYHIQDQHTIYTSTTLEDQFDQLIGMPEVIDSIKARYFLTPASKNMEEMYDTVTHYMAYEIFPKRVYQYPVNTNDQFGGHALLIQNSELLLVPTIKVSVLPPYDTVSFSVSSGWNMRSVPLTVPDYRKVILFENATTGAFAYEGTYVEKDTLENGIGYWVKYAAGESIKMHGSLITTYTIDVLEGWNLIGSISEPIATSSIGSIPSGIITSQFFEYTTAYQSTDTITPGVGYWVKVDQDGQLILSSTLVKATNRIRIIPSSEYPPPPPDQDEAGVKSIPLEYSLEQNYPNPFNPMTMISFDLPENALVKLIVYNTLGQTVAVLLDGKEVSAGSQRIELDASSLPSGVYYYRLVATGNNGNTFASVKKMLILK